MSTAEADRLLSVHLSLQWYSNHSGAWEHIKEAILDHDLSCASLPDIWTGHNGGVSCPSDLGTCDDCEVSFCNEGLLGQYPPGWAAGDPLPRSVDEDGDAYEARLCDCCGRKRRSSPVSAAE